MEGRTTFVIAHRSEHHQHAPITSWCWKTARSSSAATTEPIRANGLYAQMYRQQFWLDELFQEEEEETEEEGVAGL